MTTTRAACRIIEGVRFTRDAAGVYRGEAHGRALWAWNGGERGDPTWHWGFAPKRLGGGLGEDRNKGTRGTREDAMREAVAWAEARQAQQAAAQAEIEAAKALAAAEAHVPPAARRGLSIGDRVCRGNGRKVMTIASFREGSGHNAGQVFAKLQSGTIYDVRGLRLARSDEP